MNILILGSQGFIGSNLLNYFQAESHAVTGCDLYELPAVEYPYHKISILSPDFESIFFDRTFDVCINASGSGNVPFSIQHPFSDFEANTLAVAKVLDTLRKHNPVCKYLHISSAAVYGNPKELPVQESFMPAPVSPYGYHKLLAELTCREYYELYKVPVAIIRPFSVYGIGLKKQLLWDLSQKLSGNKTISLFGTGAETRDFLHISDLCKLILAVVKFSEFNYNIYNAASGKETSVKEVADIFAANFPGAPAIGFSGEIKKGDPKNWCADISAVRALGFSPEKDLEKEVIEYIKWQCRLNVE